jgi:ribosomal-protein-alanine N-acetyltransferase
MASGNELRVGLRKLSARDRDEFVAAMRASRKLHGPWASPPATPEAFDALLKRRRGVDNAEYLVARRAEDGAIVGYFAISQIIRGPLQSAFLGYAGVAEFSGRGYMTAGMNALFRHAFTELGLHRLEANIQPANKASIALAKRTGFVKEGFSERYLKLRGRWRDHERWAIRSEQWRERNRRA